MQVRNADAITACKAHIIEEKHVLWHHSVIRLIPTRRGVRQHIHAVFRIDIRGAPRPLVRRRGFVGPIVVVYAYVPCRGGVVGIFRYDQSQAPGLGCRLRPQDDQRVRQRWGIIYLQTRGSRIRLSVPAACKSQVLKNFVADAEPVLAGACPLLT